MADWTSCRRLGRRLNRPPLYPVAFLLFLLAPAHGAFLAPAVVAQAPSGPVMQIGLAGIPGVGVQTGYVSATGLITREVNLVADLSSFRSDGSIQTAVAVGGSIRLLGIGRTIGNTRYTGLDLDVGLRIGPGLLFHFRETQVEKNRRFNLFLEPFFRASRLFGQRLVYAELGIHRPVLRVGIWLPMGPRP